MRKKILGSAVVSLVILAILVAGCTSSDTTNSGGSSSNDKSQYLTDKFSQYYTVVTPFSKSVNNKGNTVYSGVVKDKTDKLEQYQRSVTIEALNDSASVKARYAQIKQGLQQQGYVQNIDYGTYWYGIKGGTGITDSFDAAKNRVFIEIQEPQSIGIFAGSYSYPYTLGAFNVLTSTDTKLT